MVTDSVANLKPKHLTKQEFADRLYQLMRDKGWHQSDLARAAKLPRNSVSTYIRGVSLPSPKSLQSLAEALDVTEEELLPNHVEGAIREDVPSLDLRVSTADPEMAWLQVNRLVFVSTAVKIIELLNTDSVATAHRG
jgi:transcriptional regulator with XRE-family HTH domain